MLTLYPAQNFHDAVYRGGLRNYKDLQCTAKRVPYTFFVKREWAFLLCVKHEWEFIFSVIRESTLFHPRETGFRFFVIRKIRI